MYVGDDPRRHCQGNDWGSETGKGQGPVQESYHRRQLRLIPTETSGGISPSARHVPLVKGCFRVKGKALRPRVAGGGRGHLSLCGNECSGDGRTSAKSVKHPIYKPKVLYLQS